MKDGTPTVRVATIEDNAYYRIMASAPPPEYVLGGTPEALQLADALAMLLQTPSGRSIRNRSYIADCPRSGQMVTGHSHQRRRRAPRYGPFLRRQRKFVLARKPALGDPNGPASKSPEDQNFLLLGGGRSSLA